jgi:undecaprenyl-diphosphatase
MKRKSPLLFIILSMLVILIVAGIDSVGITVFDSWFYNWTSLKMNSDLTLAMRFVTESGGPATVIILCLSLFIFEKTRVNWAFPVSFSVVIATLLNIFLKLVFVRERPDILRIVDESSYSFPSGHAMINMSFYTMIILLTWKFVKNKNLKYLISFVCVSMPLLIGFSRVYLGVHYATDVIAGWIIGFIISVIIFTLMNKEKEEV